MQLQIHKSLGKFDKPLGFRTKPESKGKRKPMAKRKPKVRVLAERLMNNRKVKKQWVK